MCVKQEAVLSPRQGQTLKQNTEDSLFLATLLTTRIPLCEQITHAEMYDAVHAKGE